MSVSCRVARGVPCPVAVPSRYNLSLRAIPYRCRSRLAGKARDCAIGPVGVCVSSPLVYDARPFYLCLVRHSQDFLCPVSSVANVESNEIRLENIDISGHILPALFSIRFTLVSHYSAFSSVRRTDVNVLNSLKHSRLSCERRRKQNNAILEWGNWGIMRGESDPKYRYSLIVSHYSLHSPR